MLITLGKNPPHQRQYLCRSLLDCVGKLIVEEADMAEVYFELVLLEKQIRAQFVSVFWSLVRSHFRVTCCTYL